MANIIIPKTNPVKYVPFELDPTEDSIRLDDRYNFDFLMASFEGKTTYTQKWRKGIPIRQQIWTQNVAIIYIKLVKCNGELITTLYRSAASLLGYLVNGVAYDINKFDYDTSAMDEQDFFMILHYGQTEETLIKEISERQQVVAAMDEMIIFRYGHSYNEYNTIFKTSYNSYFDQTFYFCIEGRSHKKKPEGIFTDYDDQKLNKTLLSAKPFDTRELTIGGGEGVPEWADTILNMIRSCDTVYIDAYKISFLDKWDKSENKNYRKSMLSIRYVMSEIEYAKVVEICDPVNAAALALPDGYVGRPYLYTQQLNGTKPFAITASTVPAGDWLKVSIIDDILYIQTLGSNYPPTDFTDFAFSVTISNPCGEVTLEDEFTIFPAEACTPVAFTGTNIIGAAVYGQPWLASIGLSGTTPFTINNVVKPAWLTITATAGGIEFSGTPNIGGSFTVSFNIENCAGPGAAITYNENFAVTSNVTLTGYNEAFRNSTPAQAGQILAAPGTLVTVSLNVLVLGTSSLTITLTGATPSVPLVSTGGVVSGTFIMPATGFVSWSGVFTSSTSLGRGFLSVS